MRNLIKVLAVLVVAAAALYPVSTVSMDRTVPTEGLTFEYRGASAQAEEPSATAEIAVIADAETPVPAPATTPAPQETPAPVEDETDDPFEALYYTANPDADPNASAEPEEGETPKPVYALQAPDCIPVQVGDKDPEGSTAIAEIQQRLIELNYLTGKADGAYGEKSSQAVAMFQAANGLQEYGVMDEETYMKLYADDVVIAPEPTPTPLVSGAKGEDVKLIQERMTTWGFSRFKPDGTFGQGTHDAVKLFQQYALDNDITIHYEALPTLVAEGETPAPDAEVTPVPSIIVNGEVDDDLLMYLTNDDFDVYREDVKADASKTETKRVQRRLVSLGYLYSSAIDGRYGTTTSRALKYFQYRNDLPETGVADEATQRKLFSADARETKTKIYDHKIIVDVSEQRVYVYEWDGRDYDNLVKKFVCSTGKVETPTPIGTFSASGPCSSGKWHYFEEFKCWAMYAFRIEGGVLFHSVTFSKQDESTMHTGALRNLGKRASHGCVRLTVEDAKWIYENCSAGITVVVQE